MDLTFQTGLSATASQLVFAWTSNTKDVYNTFAIDLNAGDTAGLFWEGLTAPGGGQGAGNVYLPTGTIDAYVYRDGDQVIADVAATPLPAALPLFATGLGGLGLLGWRRKRKAAAGA